jgi:hypothetical protein
MKLTYLSKFVTKILDEMIKLLSLSTKFLYLYQMDAFILDADLCYSVCLCPYRTSVYHKTLYHYYMSDQMELMVLSVYPLRHYIRFFLLAKKHVEFPQSSVYFLPSYWIVGQNYTNGERTLGSHY